MHEMNLAKIDLNLLVVFEALLTERGAARAGRRLGRSQPAISHALSRLRKLFRDPLFVRGPDGLAPTPRALELQPEIVNILSATRQLMASGREFCARESVRTFTIGMPDYAAFILLPGLLARMRHEAPNVMVLVRHASRATAFDMLEQGHIDMAVGNFPDPKPPLAGRKLFTDDLVCAMRRDHSALSAAWSLDQWLSLDHLHVSLAGEPSGLVDQILARRGLRRRIVATVGHFLLTPFLLAQADLVATEPRGVLAPLASQMGLALRPLPLEPTNFSVSVVWHARIRNDGGYLWLQNMFADESDRNRRTILAARALTDYG
jgi:DNA-binding transcriptional LysR family regulator